MQKNKKTGIGRIIFGVLLLGVLALAAVFAYNHYALNENFKETFYQVGSGKIVDDLRVIQISDLHDNEYGEGNEKLLSRIGELTPDIIMLTGDIVDRESADTQKAVALCGKLAEIAPVYYVYGNHETIRAFGYNDMSLPELDQLTGCTEETRSSEPLHAMTDDLKTALEAVGVNVLWNEYETLEIGGTQIDVYGVLTDDPFAFWEYAEDTYVEFCDENRDHLKLMLCHRPYIYETWYGGAWSDLTMAGHTHGGQARIPYIGGVYEYRNGLLPEFGGNRCYVAGKYDVNGSPLVVSTGLAGDDWFRINNQPELVVIDVSRY
ncbi:MAG: metallophosphoesterase [Clostridia bacterium]|nr:metallophosphoesterase [Clostridia bacterium]